jgi:hypothetical protein
MSKRADNGQFATAGVPPCRAAGRRPRSTCTKDCIGMPSAPLLRSSLRRVDSIALGYRSTDRAGPPPVHTEGNTCPRRVGGWDSDKVPAYWLTRARLRLTALLLPSS